MDKLLEAFALDVRTRNKLRNIIIHLRKHGKTVDDFIQYANEMDEFHRNHVAKQEKRQIAYEKTLLRCPECNGRMILQKVNTVPGDQTGDDSTKVHTCLKCMHQIFE